MPGDQLWFDDLRIGLCAEGPSKTITDAHYLLFSAVSGDTHPVHYDVEYAARHSFKRPVAHGLLLVAFTALGATDLSPRLSDAMVAFVDQSTSFRRPAFVGDTMRPTSEVVELEPLSNRQGRLTLATSLTNQRGEQVLVGLQRYLLLRRSDAAPVGGRS